ncbi:MAG: hypothetical protein HOK23_05365, partial [Euryarchaeota archaeon]|nr:hypothetical protein [Euryarchaeota archaeon]
NLFVSAENSQFDNYMSGPQVIEVVVIDSDIDDTDEAKGEPDVTINGKVLRMIQAVDGNWYGYFADRTQASIADNTALNVGGDSQVGLANQGLEFGTLCSNADGTDGYIGFDIGDTDGIAVPAIGGVLGGENGTATGAAITTACAAVGTPNEVTTNATNNVVREAKVPNSTLDTTATDDEIGQIGLGLPTTVTGGGAADVDGLWPFIQLYALNPTGNVVVQYNKGGGVQSTTLTFDTVDQFAGVTMDRSVYTRDAQVHLTVTDLWLNIDPTDEDSWTFGTNSSFVAANTDTGVSASADGLTTNYQVFNENGGAAGAADDNGVIDISGNFSSLMIEDNGVLILNVDAQSSGTNVITLQDNDDSILTGCTQDVSTCAVGNTATTHLAGQGLGVGSQPITITEQGPNTGVFGTYDESDVSALIVTSDALRGTSATIDYNESPVTVLTGFEFGTIDIQPIDDEWNSGEEIPVILVDNDANKNSRVDEDLDLNNPAVTLIPSLVTGDPFTLGESTNSTGPVAIYMNAHAHPITGLVTAAVANNYVSANMTVDLFSQIGRVNSTDTTQSIVGSPAAAETNSLLIDLRTSMGELRASIGNTESTTAPLHGMNLFNYDVRSFNNTGTFDIYLINATASTLIDTTTGAAGGLTTSSPVGFLKLVNNGTSQGLVSLNSTFINTQLFATAAVGGSGFALDSNGIGLLFKHNALGGFVTVSDAVDPIVADFFSFGFTNDGLEAGDRVANQIIRIEAEETGDNTGTFAGSLEYTMVNQINILDASTYTGLSTIASDPGFIVIEDLTD